MTTHWTPLACLSGKAKHEDASQDKKGKIALVVVNMPLDGMTVKFKKLWSTASVKAFADGGANQVYRIVGENPEKYIPDYISGDFDSINPDVMNFYRAKGVEVISTPDQNETDLTKCLRILICKQDTIIEFDKIVILNAFGQRLDQTMANIESLFHIAKVTNKPVYLMSEDSIACLLLPGNHVVHVNTGLEGDWCGLIPIGAKCTQITTTGLKYNLTDGQLAFGSLVSTSNTYDGSDSVTVQTDTAVLWTMGIINCHGIF